jgi:hypothetical protein
VQAGGHVEDINVVLQVLDHFERLVEMHALRAISSAEMRTQDEVVADLFADGVQTSIAKRRDLRGAAVFVPAACCNRGP